MGKRLLRVTGLWGFAVTIPLLDVMSRSPSLFTTIGTSPLQIVVFALLAIAAGPVLLFAVEAVVMKVAGASASEIVHLVWIAVLATLMMAPIVRRLGLHDALSIVMVVAGGVAVVVAYRRTSWLPRLLVACSLAAPVFVAWFLIASPVSALVRGGVVPVYGSADTIGKRPPIILIVFDEFPLASLVDTDGEIDRARYPNFGRLADGTTWYRNTTAASDSTAQAIPSLLSGLHVAPHTAQVPTAVPRNLFTLLGSEYRFHGRARGLCPRSVCPDVSGSPADVEPGALLELLGESAIAYGHIVSPGGIADRLPAVEALGLGLREPAVEPGTEGAPKATDISDPRLSEFEKIVRQLQLREGHVHILHELLPHRPWTLLPDGRTHSPLDWRIPGLSRDFRWGADPSAPRGSYIRHLTQLAAVDSAIGDVLDRLERSPLFDDAILVVTADHGITFREGENSRLMPNAETLTDIAMLPLFVKYPGQARGRTDDSPASSVDVLPTLIDVLGIDPGWDLDGRSLLDEGRRPQRTLLDSSGRILPLPDELLDVLRDAARDKLARTGWVERPQNETEAFFAADPRVGRDVTELTVRPSTGWTIRWGPDWPHTPNIFPAAITAFGDAEFAGAEIAVSVNGRVAAIARSFLWRGRAWIDTTLLPDAIRPGKNEVAFLVLHRGTG